MQQTTRRCTVNALAPAHLYTEKATAPAMRAELAWRTTVVLDAAARRASWAAPSRRLDAFALAAAAAPVPAATDGAADNPAP